MKLDLITNKAKTINGVNKNDEFYTPIYAIEPLLKYLKPGSKILCPFDTSESNYVKYLTEMGMQVDYSHIFDNKDFFKIDNVSKYDYIISNPPYSLKYEVFNHLFKLGKPFAMLVGVVGLFESQKRFNMFKDNDFEIMYLNKRVSYFKDYNDQTPNLNPPFSSVYITKDILPNQIIFEEIDKSSKR